MRFVAVLIVLVAWSAGHSQPRPRRALIVTAATPAAKRLVAELRAVGWQTNRVPAARDARLDLIGLHARMTNDRATAAIALVPGSPDGTDVWIMDDVGMVVSQEHFAGAAPPELLALRTVERLRAYRIKVATTVASDPVAPQTSSANFGKPRRQHADLEVPKDAARDATEPSLRGAAQLSGGLALGWAPGGLSPTGQLRIGGSWLPHSWLAADLVVLLPIVPSRVRAGKGESDVHIVVTGLALRWLGGGLHSWVRPSIGAGVGALVVRLRGYSKDPEFDSYRDWLACALPFMEGGVVFRISSHLRLVSSLMVGIAVPRVVIAYLGADTAIGKPMLTGTIGIQLELP